MNLFSKEKELILKITNGVLVIWIIASLCFVVSNIVNLTVKNKEYIYEEYKIMNCSYTNEMTEEECQTQYQRSILYDKNDVRSNVRNLIISISVSFIVVTTTYLLNKPKKQIKK